MIAVDTNILVYAHRADSSFHEPGARLIAELVEGTTAWAIPWPCLHEFYGTVTHPRVFRPPSTVSEGLTAIERWLEVPNLVVLTETPDHWTTLKNLVESGAVVGARIHDARIAAICLQHGVRELWTADRDFGRFPALKVVNPLVG